MEEPEGTIGYCAVIVPALDEFQGMFLVDNETVRPEALKLQLNAIAMGGAVHPSGSLQAALVEGVLTGNQPLTAAAALALHGFIRNKFFVVQGDRQAGGTVTRLIELRANSVEAARQEIDNLPVIQQMKARLIREATSKKKH